MAVPALSFSVSPEAHILPATSQERGGLGPQSTPFGNLRPEPTCSGCMNARNEAFAAPFAAKYGALVGSENKRAGVDVGGTCSLAR